MNRFQEHRVIWKRRGAFRSATRLFCPPAGLRWGQGPVMGGTAPPRRQGSAWIPPAGPRRSAAGRRTCPREPPPQSGPPCLSSRSPPRNLACPHPMSGPRLVPRCAPVPRSAEETTCSLRAHGWKVAAVMLTSTRFAAGWGARLTKRCWMTATGWARALPPQVAPSGLSPEGRRCDRPLRPRPPLRSWAPPSDSENRASEPS